MRIAVFLRVATLSAGLLAGAPLPVPAQQAKTTELAQVNAERDRADRLFNVGKTEEAKAIYARIASSFPKDFEFNRRLAYCYYVSPGKEMAKAATYYARAYALNPKDPEVEMNLARAYSWSAQYSKAIDMFRGIVEKNPANSEAWVQLARAQSSGGQQKAASDTYEAYLERWPADREVRLEYAAVLSWNKQFDAALAQYRAILKSSPDDLKARLGEAQLLSWQPGKIPEGLQAYEEILKRDPKQYDALRGKAFDLYWLGRYDEAGRVFAEVNKQKPPDKDIQDTLRQIAKAKAEESARRAKSETDALRDQAQAAVGQKDYARAIDLMNQAIQKAPQDASLRMQLGQVYAWSRQWDKAIATLRSLYAEQPDNLDALRELADAQVGANQLADAAANYRALLERKPDDFGSRLNLARVLSWSGKLDDSRAVYQQVLAEKPNNFEATLGLAQVSAWSGKNDEALKLFDQILSMQPENRDAQLGKAQVLYWTGNTKPALEILQKMQETWPQDTEVDRVLKAVQEAEHQRALQRAAAGRPVDVEASIRRQQDLLAQNPNDQGTLMTLGSLYSQKADYKTATTYYEKALEQRPGDKDLRLTLARVASWNRDYPRSISLYQGLVAEDPGNRDERTELAKVLSWSGHNQEAIQQYQQLLKENPQDTDTRLQMARVMSWNQQLDASLQEYKRVLQADPQNREAQIETARVNSWKGDMAAALDLYNQVLSKDPQNTDARLGKAQVLFWSGHPREAKGILADLQVKAPQNRDVALTMAGVNSALGRRDLALQQLDELNKLQPGSPDVVNLQQAIRRDLRPLLIVGFTPSQDSYDLDIYYFTSSLYFSPTPQIRSYFSSNIIPSRNTPLGTSATGREFLFGSYARVTDWLLVRAEGGLNSDVFGKNGGIWGVGGTLFPLDNMQFDLNVSRRFINFIPRPVVLDINRIQYRGAWDWRPHRRVGVHADYYHENYSDSNRNNGGNFSLTGKPVLGERSEVEVGYLYSTFGFTKNIDSGFFAPTQYQRHAALLNLRGKLTPRNTLFFWGSLGQEQIFHGNYRWDGTARAGWECQLNPHTKLTLGYGYFAITSIVRAGAYRTNTGYATVEYRF